MRGANQEHSANRSHRQKSEAPARLYPEPGKDPVTDYSPDQTQGDIGYNSVTAAAHQLARNPAGDESDDNCSERMQRFRVPFTSYAGQQNIIRGVQLPRCWFYSSVNNPFFCRINVEIRFAQKSDQSHSDFFGQFDC